SVTSRSTAAAAAALSVSVNTKSAVPASPSGIATSSIVTATLPGGGSSSLSIVPTPWLSVIDGPTGAVRFTKNVSSGSKSVSPLTTTVNVAVSSPTPKSTTELAGS